MYICIGFYNSRELFIFKIMQKNARNLAENLRRSLLFSFFGDRLKIFLKTFFLRTLAHVSLVLGLEHPCPWPREGLSLALDSDFFVSLALASSLVSSTPCLSKALKRCYFVNFSGQSGSSSPPPRPLPGYATGFYGAQCR